MACGKFGSMILRSFCVLPVQWQDILKTPCPPAALLAAPAVAMIFCSRMYSGLDANFMGEPVMPLTTLYRFVREDGVNVNSEWMLEQYKDDFTITAK